MAFQLNNLSGSLFKNHRKTSDNQPNAKGEALIGGVAYWVSAWTKKDKNGNPWQSLSFTPKDDRPAQAQTSERMDASNKASMDAQKPAPVDDFDQEIPF